MQFDAGYVYFGPIISDCSSSLLFEVLMIRSRPHNIEVIRALSVTTTTASFHHKICLLFLLYCLTNKRIKEMSHFYIFLILPAFFCSQDDSTLLPRDYFYGRVPASHVPTQGQPPFPFAGCQLA